MKDNCKMKKISFFLVLAMLFNTFVAVVGANSGLVSSVEVNGNVVSLSGTTEEANAEVNVFLLNSGKTVADLSAATDADSFSAVVNYCKVLTSNDKKGFSDEFVIKNMEENRQYLLYVKSGSETFLHYIGSQRIYVSKDGSDTKGDGSEENPFATVTKARDYLRTAKISAPVEVIIGGGVYDITETIIFNSKDSREDESPVTYKAATGEKVVFNGATKLDVSKFSSVTDADMLSRLQPQVADKVVEIDLAAQGISSTVVDFLAKLNIGSKAKTIGLFLNDNRQNIARWPNAGYETILSCSTAGGSASDQSAGGAVVKISGLDSERAQRWANQTNMYVEGYLNYDWYSEWAKVASVDADDLSVTLDTYTQYGVAEGQRIAVVNLPEEIDLPGEWYADADNMKLYYYPPYDLTAEDDLEIATLCYNFITVSGASNINFEGIEFAKNANSPNHASLNNSNGNGIAITTGSKNINVTDCIFRNIGMEGIVVNNSTDVLIDGCTIYDTGYSGISVLSGTTSTLTSGNVVVSNSVIMDSSRDSGANLYAGIRITGGVGTTIENNIFSNMKNSAIRYAGNAHVIKNNEIYNSVNETNDAGAIYAGRSWVNYGTVIENNYFHDLGADFDADNLASAVFWDDNHSGNTFVGNLVDMRNQKQTSGVTIGGGRDNTIEGNIIVNSGYGIYGEDRDVTIPSSYDESDTSSFYNSTLFQSFTEATNGVTNAYNITDSDWLTVFSSTYPTILTNYNQIRNNRKYTRVETIKDNVTYNCADDDIILKIYMSLASTKSGNVTLSASDFVDAANGDYRVKSSVKSSKGLSSSVLDETFKMSSIGLTNSVVTAAEISSFDLVYPANKGIVAGKSTTLAWNESPYADSYTYEVATDSDFTNVVATGTTVYTTAEVSGLEAEKEYFWRVTAENKSQQLGSVYECEEQFSFTTSGDLIFKIASYDKTENTVSVKVQNTSDEDKLITVIAAEKTSTGTLIGARPVDVTVGANEIKTVSVDATFEEDDKAATVELYVWSELKNLTEKFSFTK